MCYSDLNQPKRKIFKKNIYHSKFSDSLNKMMDFSIQKTPNFILYNWLNKLRTGMYKKK